MTPTPKTEKPKRPVKTEGYSHAKATTRLNKRRREADIRQGTYDALTTAEKIARATNRGGSKKELAKLTAIIKKKDKKASK